jgi:tripartite-type tricarboxylate transporter receptor subunit TctC
VSNVLKRWLWGTSVLLLLPCLLAACAPTGPAPTQAPAKPTEAPKPTAAPAAPQVAAPTPSPKPGTEPPAKPAASPAVAAKAETYDERAVADFYRGKTFRILVGLAPGGGFDTIYRIWGRHAGKHIPGNPNVIVENMTGAGGLVATNHLYNVASRDGTTLGTMDMFLTVLGYKAGAKGLEFDPSKFNWIGNPRDPSPPVCAVRTELGINSFSEFLTSGKELVLGASGRGNIFYATPRVVAAATGAKIKVVDGYAGNPAVRLAVDNKELDGACWTLASMRTTGPQWFEGDPPPMRIILQAAKAPYADLPNVELLRSFVTDPSQLKMVDVLEEASYNTYLAAFPPEVPADRMAALRDAYIKTWNDPDLKEELARTQFNFAPASGEETESVINEFLAMSPDEGKRIGQLFGLVE